MSQTYPSREAVSADVRDPDSITAKFVYNFFVPDEGVSEKGDRRRAFGYLSAQTQALIDNRTMEREVPRFVVLDIKRVFKGRWRHFPDEQGRVDMLLTTAREEGDFNLNQMLPSSLCQQLL